MRRSFPSSAAADALVTVHVHAPPVPSRGVVVFLHGLGLHGGMPRYDPMVRLMQAEALEVWAWDCPHHGLSSRLGDPAHPLRPLRLPRELHLVADAVQLCVEVRRVHGESTPLVLVGESMGGALALRIAPVVRPTGVCCIAGVGEVPHVLPRLRGAFQFARMILRAPTEELRAAKEDPLIQMGLPAVGDTLRRLLCNTRYVDVRCPTLLCVGTQDPLSTVRATLRVLVRCTSVPSLRRSIHVVGGGRHDDLVVRAAGEVAAFCADAVTRPR